ncbi:MAG: 1,4-alpha-glucan branching enzyme [Promethearchaeota archaeon]|nr:MAG: 1,4-alpha-glucan branching enzyme [Candidatus Lokiarchaeota archaeon]
MNIGYFGLLLHGHMPWCKKSGTWPAGEQWYTEAALETYIPMLNILRELKEDDIKTAITINITPILAELMGDEYMKQRFSEYVEDLIDRAKNDIQRYENHPKRKAIAQMHLKTFQKILDSYYHNYYRDLLGSFKWLQEEEMVEIITSCATHGFLPLFEYDSGIFSQIQLGVDTYKKYFHKDPKGFWLPECAYRPKQIKNGEVRESIDYWLHNSGIDYFFVDSHGILTAEILEKSNNIGLSTNFGYNLERNISVFGRNKKTSRQVWDAQIGYPGDDYYMEFHKKDSESGLRYWRITGKDVDKNNKDLYNSEIAKNKIKEHAQHFLNLLIQEASEFWQEFNKRGIIVSPYDFELYGHWWAEGIQWLKDIFTLIHENKEIEMITFSDYTSTNKEEFSTIKMKESTWGAGGHFQVWNDEEHRWIWPYINSSIKDFQDVLKKNHEPNDWETRVLRQIARELLLMEGSDWPFLLYTQQAKEYANKRFHHHHQRFNKLLWAAKKFGDSSRIKLEELEKIEDIDSCFDQFNLDYFRKID